MTRVPMPLVCPVCPHPGGDVVTHLEGSGGVAQVRGEGTRGRRPGQHLPGGPAGHEELLVAAGIECGQRGGVGGGQGGGHLAVIAVGVRVGGSRDAAGPAAGAGRPGPWAPVTSGTSSGGCGQTAAAISIWTSRKGYLTCRNSPTGRAVPGGGGDVHPDGGARAETAGTGRAAAPVLLVLVGVWLQVQLHEHRMHDAPFPRLIALLLTGACHAGKNTCYSDRRRAAPILTGFARMAA